ncbi:MAG: glycosyltransferase [Acidobacteria bacterium]|nr:glycosyltransferase [Acidobacteriota bacterium]
MISVIVPAYNEEKCLPETLKRIRQALSVLTCPSEVIVVDNDSEDGTKQIAESFGAKIFPEKEHNISRVRNTGARNSGGDVLVFVDADTMISELLLQEIVAKMNDEKCFGGAVSVAYETSQRRWIKFYLLGWKFWEKVVNAKQGATQFCRRETFTELGGYNESIYLGEDVEFYWRLSKLAKRKQGFLFFIENLKVTTSARRFDKMSWWKTILLTNPLLIRLAWKRKGFWKDWYEKAVR